MTLFDGLPLWDIPGEEKAINPPKNGDELIRAFWGSSLRARAMQLAWTLVATPGGAWGEEGKGREGN